MARENPAQESTSAIQFERIDDFASSYANNVNYEQTAWDLKLIFGQVDGNVVRQHLAVTIPWPQAKLAAFWLRVQVESAEAYVGAKIPIRKDLIPAELPSLTPEQEKDPAWRAFYELYSKAREDFIATL